MFVDTPVDLCNPPFRFGNGLARVRPKVEEKRKKPDRLPDGRRVDLIAAHEGRPQQVSPLWKVADNTADRVDLHVAGGNRPDRNPAAVSRSI